MEKYIFEKVKKALYKERVIKIRTLTTYYHFKKRFPESLYNRKDKTYQTYPFSEKNILETQKRIKKKKEKQIQLEKKEEELTKETEEYKRDALILTASYKGETMFDLRASIVNSNKRDTFAYLTTSLLNKWDDFLSIGTRNRDWTQKITKAVESEYVDKKDIDTTKIGKVVIDSMLPD